MTTIYREYIIPLPLTLPQYRRAQLFTVANISTQQSTGDTAIQIDANEDMDHEEYGACRYTNKVFFLNSKVPGVIRAVVPGRALVVEEVAYNAFPKCWTAYTNRAFEKDTFMASVVSNHYNVIISDGNGNNTINNIAWFSDYNMFKTKTNKHRENVYAHLGIPDKDFHRSTTKVLDICENIQDNQDCNNMLVEGIRMEKGWYNRHSHMVCAKFVTIKFECFGLGWLVYEIEKHVDRLFLSAHQQMICGYEGWKGLSMEDIRVMEDVTRSRLNEKKGEVIE